MASLAHYIISVICAAFICGIITDIVKTGKTGKIIKLLCSVFLSLTVIRPIAGIHHFVLELPDPAIYAQGIEAASRGEKISQAAIADIIRTETEAYILNKASERNAAVKVMVELSEDFPPKPIAVEISGDVPPPVQNRLRNLIESDLGIPKENQLWNGAHSQSKENNS